MKRTLLLLIPVLYLSLLYSQDIQIKDSADQLLLQVNDEGDNKSSITVPTSGTAPSITDNKLYNEAGTLKWSGNTLGASSEYVRKIGDTMTGNLTMFSADILLQNTNSQLKVAHSNSGYLINVANTINSGIYYNAATNQWEWYSGGVSKGKFDFDTGNLQIDGNLNVSGNAIMQGFKLSTGASNGYVLTSDGTGIGTWQAQSVANDGDWTISGSDIYSTVSGNVGIGTTSPLSKLSVGADGQSTATIYCENPDFSAVAIRGVASNTMPLTYTTGGAFSSAGTDGKGVSGSATYDGTSGQNYGGYFEASGEYGRGVKGQANYTGNSTNYGGEFFAAGAYGIGIRGHALHDTGENYGVYGGTSSPNGWAGYFSGRGYFSENVGIGTTTPDEKLHIVGNMKMIDGNQADGKVLTSDANGVGTWQTASGGSDITEVSSGSGLTGGGTSGVVTLSINNGGVTTAHIANSTITSQDIADGTIYTVDIANNSITAADIANNAVGANELADNSVDTNSIVDGAVNSSKVDFSSPTVKIGIGTASPNSKLSIVGLLEYTGNADAISAGLVAGDLYRTGELLKIVY